MRCRKAILDTILGCIAIAGSIDFLVVAPGLAQVTTKQVNSDQFIDEIGVPYQLWQSLSFSGSLPVLKSEIAHHDMMRLPPVIRHYWNGVILKIESKPEESVREFEHCRPFDRISDVGIQPVIDSYARAEGFKTVFEITDARINSGKCLPEIYTYRADTYMAIGKNEKAASDYQKYASLVPVKRKLSLGKAAECLRYAHKYDEAIGVCTLALRDTKAPNDPYLYTTRAHCYDALKKWPQAVADYTESIRLSRARTSASPLKNLVYNTALSERAKVYENMGSKDLAAKDRAELDRLSRDLEIDAFGKGR